MGSAGRAADRATEDVDEQQDEDSTGWIVENTRAGATALAAR